jgi:hypothetical protein
MGASLSRHWSHRNDFVPFPIQRRDEIMRVRLERTIMHPLVLSMRKNGMATIFEHLSCAGSAPDVESAMSAISAHHTSGDDCVFSFVSSNNLHIVCMWLVRRRVALCASVQSARAHPRRLFLRMRKWMAGEKTHFYVVQSRIHNFSLFSIAADFGVKRVKMCNNSIILARFEFVGRRIRGLRIDTCDPAAHVCEEVRELLAICDEVSAPIGALADADAPLRESTWTDRGVQLRIRALCADLRAAVRARCASQECIQALRAGEVVISGPGIAVRWRGPRALCAACARAAHRGPY